MDAKYARQELLWQLKGIVVAKGISYEQIAEKTGLKPSNISRMLNGKYSCTVDNLIKVVEAVGFKVRVEEQP
jgi:DNA-binding phage protein